MINENNTRIYEIEMLLDNLYDEQSIFKNNVLFLLVSYKNKNIIRGQIDLFPDYSTSIMIKKMSQIGLITSQKRSYIKSKNYTLHIHTTFTILCDFITEYLTQINKLRILYRSMPLETNLFDEFLLYLITKTFNDELIINHSNNDYKLLLDVIKYFKFDNK